MTKIEWCDETVNPITVVGGGHWCKKISEGCANCYAEVINNGNRFDFASHLKYSGNAPELQFNEDMVQKWTTRRARKSIFVCSMTDWCGDWVSRDWQNMMIKSAKQSKCTFLFLTKRPNILIDVLQYHAPANNLWFGVSVENQQRANERLPILRHIKEAHFQTFVSFEPLLGDVRLNDLVNSFDCAIVGAESGKGARPMSHDWVRSLRDEVKTAGKSFCFKQDAVNGKKNSLPQLDGRSWFELPWNM